MSRKRAADDDLVSQHLKRVRGEGETGDPTVVGTLAFLLDPSNPLALYDATTIPASIVVEIVIRTLEFLPPQLLEDRLNVAPFYKVRWVDN